MSSKGALGDKSPDQWVKFEPLRLEQAKLTDAGVKDYSHAFLTDVSGKKIQYTEVNFSFAVLVRGYFHHANFVNCKFIGTRFTDCNFRNASFSDCDFRYADFTGTRIPTDEMLRNLPDEPNIRREFLQILRKNAISLGDVASSRRFVLAEIDAKKEHYRRAWRQDETYYKKKYSGFRKLTLIGAQRVGLWIDSFLWGHGERLWKIAISVPVLLIISAAISTIYWSSGQSDPKLSSLIAKFWEAFRYYTSLFLDVQNGRNIDRMFWLDWTVVVARYVAFGVLIAGLFRWLSHR